MVLAAVALPPAVAAAAPRPVLVPGAASPALLQPAPRDEGEPAPPGAASAAASSARAAEQQARAAEQQAKAAVRAARQAAQLAQAGQRARVIWQERGRPRKLVVIRPNTIDLVGDGRLMRRVPGATGVVTPAALERHLPRSWLVRDGGTVDLAAAVVLTPGTTLDVGGEVTLLRLAGGPRSSDAASIYTGGGRLVLHGVTVTSAAPGAPQPMPPASGRPFIVVSQGGRLDATDTTFTDLGTSRTESRVRAGVQFNIGSGGSLTRTALLRNSTGLQLVGTQDVRLTDVTVSESYGDGLVLADNRGMDLGRVRSVRNRGDGVRVTGSNGDRAVTGITVAENGGFGIAASRVAGVRFLDLRTSGNGSGGLELSQAAGVTVTDLTATDEPIGVYTRVNSTDIVLERLTISGGRRGVVVEKTTRGLALRSSVINRAKVTGVAVSGSDVALHDTAVSDSGTDVRIERAANRVTATGLRLSGGRDGLVAAPGTTGLVLEHLTVQGIENDAVRSFSPDARILDATITGATTGIHLGAPAVISRTSIRLVNDGIRSRATGPVHADHVEVEAVAIGIDVAPTGPFVLTDSRVHALDAVRGELIHRGTNDLSLPPLNLLGAIGVPLVLLAFALQCVHFARLRGTGLRVSRWTPPAVPVASVRRSLARSADDSRPTRGSRSVRSAWTSAYAVESVGDVPRPVRPLD